MKRLLLVLVSIFALCGPLHAVTPSCTAYYATGSSGVASVAITVAATGDFIGIFTTTGVSGGHYVTSIADTFSSSLQNSLYGTFNTSGTLYNPGSFLQAASAFYGYAASSGSDTVTVTWTASASNEFVFVADCTNVQTVGAPVSNIVNNQASVTGTNAITTSGGTGSGSVNSGDIVLAWGGIDSTSWTAGTSPNAFTRISSSGNSQGELETFVTGSTGTLYATMTATGTFNAFSWQLALAPGAGGSCTNAGWSSAGSFAVPNGSSGSYWLKSGAFGTPNCSSTSYYQQSGAFGTN